MIFNSPRETDALYKLQIYIFDYHNAQYTVNNENLFDSNNTCFGACSMGTQHGNLHQSAVRTSAMTCFILRADTVS